MTIGGVSCGERTTVALDQPRRWISAGISKSGAVSVTDFGKTVQEVPIVFRLMSESTKNSLKTALMTSTGVWGTVSITPDSGDDLQVGASGATNFIFLSFLAEYEAPGPSGPYWTVTVRVMKII
jgi:hypothetical protein